ncbi:amino acid adenylation domain-containing protein [Clostridium sp. LP20]|uniref:amino acid adenylation domain-containing protein n=1 Tax=Clostridium sp. LP20 TaxID=3418665 RepID=UPI003EE56C7D
MKRCDIIKKVNEIFVEVFDDNDIKINESTCADDIDDWDSLMHITLISVIEKKFNIKFSMQDVLGMQSVGEMLDIIENINKYKDISILYGKSSSNEKKNIIELFECVAKQNSEKIAVRSIGVSLSYIDMLNAVNCLSNKLIRANIKDNDRIGVLTKNNVETIISIFAILRVGAVYVPLDANLPQEKMDYILQDSKARLLLITDNKSKNNSKIESLGVDYLELSKFKEKVDKPYPASDVNSYVIYTSGTTGYPKGVEIKNDWIINLCNWNKAEAHISENSKVMMLFSFAFDASIKNIFTPLTTGAELILGPDFLFDINEILIIIEENKVTHCNTSPGLFYSLLEYSEKKEFLALGSLRYVMLGGETLEKKPLKKWADSKLEFIIINSYGPTEATSITTSYIVKKEDIKEEKSIPIGVPINNKVILIINEKGEICANGEIGEIYIGGLGVINKYISKSEALSNAFIDNVNGIEGNFYKTGDMGRINENLQLEFCGRRDNQIKIRGHRVELKEIEEVLNRSDYVYRSVCIYLNKDNKEEIVAFLHLKNALLWDEKALRVYLENKISDFMVPQKYIICEEFPKNINGKIDKKELIKFYYSKINDEKLNRESKSLDEIINRNDVEKKLTQVWKDILGIDCIGLEENFFDVGGYSLLLTKLSRKIEGNLDCKITILDLMTYTNIKSCAEFICNGKNNIEMNESNITKNGKSVEKLKKRLEMINKRKQRRVESRSRISNEQ